METSQLYQGLTFLAYATGIIVILVGCMLVKVLFNLSTLTQNINETTEIIKTELSPTLKNINKTVEILSSIVIKTDEGINKVKEFIKKSPFGIITKLSSATGSVAKGLFCGLSSAIRLFFKKK